MNGWVLGPVSIIVGVSLLVTGAVAVDATPGQQGTDTSLAATPSQVTVSGRGAFAGMKFTVNQTKALSNQAISITWTGGVPTTRQTSRFGANFVQIYQCWGDDDGTVPENPGPPAEQCEAGAYGATANGGSSVLFSDPMVTGRIISRVGWKTDDPNRGVLDAAGFQRWLQFRAVDGTEIGEAIDPSYNPFLGGNYWTNPYFNSITTNEIPGAVTNLDGTGAELFQVLTGDEAAGLGCGKKTKPAGTAFTVPKCWLVIVPRGDQAMEHVDTPFASYGESIGVSTSPLAANAWRNRVAIPLEFNPVDSPCAFGSVDRRIAGNEMALPAVANWQPSLCESGSLPPFSYAPVSDGTARSLLTSGVDGAAGMAVVGRPLDPLTLGDDNPVVYAPLTLSGIVIGFNIERRANATAPQEMVDLTGVRVAQLNLTPRLVAKLLTQSYGSQVTIYQKPKDEFHAFVGKNPDNMTLDPDFLRFNPEFTLMFTSQSRTFGGLQLPAGNSDAAEQLWNWVLADPEARAWLAGAADEYGMVVNPYYNSKPTLNPSKGEFYKPVPNSFPKADPFCYQAPAQGAGGSVIPPLLCGTDWVPYARGFRETAQVARSASDGARVVPNPLAEAASAVWGRSQPQGTGDRAMLAVTDSPSAAQFGLQVASLSRAGDDGAAREFVTPTNATLTAAVKSMKNAPGTDFLLPSPSPSAGSYPLATVDYAALTPLKLPTAARSDYAAFLRYAANKGQVPGLGFGQLPRGYAPLTAGLKSQTLAAAAKVTSLQPTPTTSTTSTTVATEPPETTYPDSGGGYIPPDPGPPPVIIDPPTETSVEVVDTTTTVVSSVPPTVPPTPPSPGSTYETVVTPPVDLPRNRYTVPGVGMIALGSALGVLEITKRPRKAQAALLGTNAPAGAGS